MSEEVSLKVATAGDGQGLLTLLRRVEQVSSAVVVPNLSQLTAKDEDKQLAQIADQPNCLVLLAMLEKQPIGVLTLMPPDDQLDHKIQSAVQDLYWGLAAPTIFGELGIAVDPAYWHQGVGSLLIDEGQYWLANYSALDLLALSVFDDNQPALGLYKKAGFSKVGSITEVGRPATLMAWRPVTRN